MEIRIPLEKIVLKNRLKYEDWECALFLTSFGNVICEKGDKFKKGIVMVIPGDQVSSYTIKRG